jgi:hypothetical protein
LIVAVVADEIHPAAFFTVTLYVPGATPVNILLCLYNQFHRCCS